MTDFDLVIVGGGPVGLVTAIAARGQGFSAAVLEQNPELPEKACGEGLMPGAVAVLDALGVPLRDAVEFRGIRFLDGAEVASAEFPEQKGRAIGRLGLMEALTSRARAVGVTLLPGHTLRDFRQHGPLISADVSAAGQLSTLRGRLLVGADGLRSGVRRRLGYELPPRRPLRYGLQRHYRCAPWTDWVEVHWEGRAEAYVTPIGRGEVGVALLSQGAPGRYDELLRRFPAIERRLAQSEWSGRVRGAGPFEQRVRAVLAPGVALVGDAAGYLDAVSGDGLALGFRSAVALVDRFAAGELWRYPRDHARLCFNHRALTALLLEAARRPGVRRFLIRQLGAHPELFSDLLGIASDARAPARSLIGTTLRWLLPRGELPA